MRFSGGLRSHLRSNAACSLAPKLRRRAPHLRALKPDLTAAIWVRLQDAVTNLSPNEDSEPTYFAYSATLRIHGADLPIDEITLRLGVEPSNKHRRGDQRLPGARPYPSDAWHLKAAIPEEIGLSMHLRELWRVVEPHIGYLRSLDATVDVFCGYRSNNGAAGFEIEPDALEIFRALNVPFGLSVIVDSWLAQRLDEPTIQ